MTKELFSLKQKYEMLTAIEGRGEVPVKFIYLGKGAENWRKYRAKNTKPKVAGLEYHQALIMEEKLPSIWASLKGSNLNIIDLGPGDGGPAVQILNYATKRAKNSNLKYVPIDISKAMLKQAIGAVRKQFSGTVEPYLIDFESGNFSDVTFKLRNGTRTNFMVLLGNTLGNTANMQRVLTNFRESMTRNDYLLLGVELVNEHLLKRMVKQYVNDDLNRLVFWPLEYHGAKRQHGKFKIRFNHKLSRIEMYFVPTKDITLKIGYEKFTLKKDAGIILATSTKFSTPLLTDLLGDAGFRIDYLTTTHENNFALVLCQPAKVRNPD